MVLDDKPNVMNYKVGNQIKDFSSLNYGDVVYCKLYDGKFELRRYLNANKGNDQLGAVKRLLSIEVDTKPLNDDNPHEVFSTESIFEAIKEH